MYTAFLIEEKRQAKQAEEAKKDISERALRNLPCSVNVARQSQSSPDRQLAFDFEVDNLDPSVGRRSIVCYRREERALSTLSVQSVALLFTLCSLIMYASVL